MYMKWADLKTNVVTPEDAEANGLVENVMNILNKVWHANLIENKIHNKKSTNFCVRIEPLLIQQQDSRPFKRPFKTRLPEHPELVLRQDLWQ